MGVLTKGRQFYVRLKALIDIYEHLLEQLVVNHTLTQGSNGILAQEMLGNGIAELHGSCRATACDELAVLGNYISSVLGALQLTLHTGIAGCLNSFQNTQMTLHHRSGTDGGKRFALGMMLQDGLTQRLALIKIGTSGQSAG